MSNWLILGSVYATAKGQCDGNRRKNCRLLHGVESACASEPITRFKEATSDVELVAVFTDRRGSNLHFFAYAKSGHSQSTDSHISTL